MGIDEDMSAKIKSLKERFIIGNTIIGDPATIIKKIIEILVLIDETKTVKRKYYGKNN